MRYYIVRTSIKYSFVNLSPAPKTLRQFKINGVIRQMALESTTCGIVHHACRTRAHCPTMVPSFKLSSGTVCLPGFAVSINLAMHLVEGPITRYTVFLASGHRRA